MRWDGETESLTCWKAAFGVPNPNTDPSSVTYGGPDLSSSSLYGRVSNIFGENHWHCCQIYFFLSSQKRLCRALCDVDFCRCQPLLYGLHKTLGSCSLAGKPFCQNHFESAVSLFSETFLHVFDILGSPKWADSSQPTFCQTWLCVQVSSYLSLIAVVMCVSINSALFN